MDDNDFKFIESRLAAALPEIYRRFMGRFPNDSTYQLQNDSDTLPTNAELFAIRQLQRFNNDKEFDYYELQPDLRSRRFMDIGGDGFGNFYCMPGDDAHLNELWMWEHDPYNGLTLQADMSLADYFGSQWKLVTQVDPFAAWPATQRMISRADHPLRSILNPITISEWRECVANTAQLEFDEFQEMINPFTKEAVRIRRWPGRAKFHFGDSSAQIGYLHGCLTLSSAAASDPTKEAAMRLLAENLNAKLL